MKINAKTIIVILVVGLATAVVGAILMGIAPSGDYNIQPLGSTLRDIGFITAVLCGIILTGLSVSGAVNGENQKKD